VTALNSADARADRRVVLRRAAVALSSLAVLALLAGCGCGKKEEPKPPTTAAEDVSKSIDEVNGAIQSAVK